MEPLTLKINEIFYSIQGESLFVGKPTVFVRTAACNLRCVWCLAPETLVLRADLTYRPIAGLVEGDEVVGFAQVPGMKQKRIVRTRVLRIERKADVERIRIRTEWGEIVTTPDHPIWHSENRDGATYGRWRQARHFTVGDGIKVFPVPAAGTRDEEAYSLGYLAGVADGDGTFWDFAPKARDRTYRRFRLAALDREMIDRFRRCAGDLGFEFSDLEHGRTGFSGIYEKMPSLYLLGGDQEVTRFQDLLCRGKMSSTNPSFWRGYLGGIFDAEGSLSCGILRISQGAKNVDVRSRINEGAKILGFTVTEEDKGFVFLGGLVDHLRFFALCTPAISRKKNDFFGYTPKLNTRVVEVGVHEKGEVITLTTECGTFIADGHVVKNCDTGYSFWRGKVITLDAIVAEVKKHPTRYVCVTGGEPLGQRATIPLLRRLLDEGYTVSLETNGSFSIQGVPNEVIKVIDLKCPDSGEVEANQWENLRLAAPQDQFKFVLASRGDFDWAQEVCRRHSPRNVLYSPVHGRVKPEDLAQWILDAGAPVTMQLQMHKEIWGPSRRGV